MRREAWERSSQALPSERSSKKTELDSGPLPDVVMALDVDLVENPFGGFQEVFLHLHGHVPGQEAHQQSFLHMYVVCVCACV